MTFPLPICAEQRSLPGLPKPVREWAAPPDEPLELRIEVSDDQLRLDAEQPVLTPEPLPARQLPLLADPPLWEQEPGSRRRRRPGRRQAGRSSKGDALSPGQMSLF